MRYDPHMSSPIESLAIPPYDILGRRAPWQVLRAVTGPRLDSTSTDRWYWSMLRDFLSGVHLQHLMAVAAIAYPERSGQWAAGGGHAYRTVRLVEMLADRLCVAFHRPPRTWLHLGDDVPLSRDDPQWGAQVRQWERDWEDGRLDETLRAVERTERIQRNAVVVPTWISDGDVQRIDWQVLDPHQVRVVQSDTSPSDLSLARAVSLELRLVSDVLGIGQETRLSTWTRDVGTGGQVVCGHWTHDEAGVLRGDQLWDDGLNRYGLIPAVLWQSLRPATGSLWLPPDEDLIRAQLALDLGITDLCYGLRFQAHPQPTVYGQVLQRGGPVFGPDALLQLEEGGRFEYVSVPLVVSEVIKALEWLLRVQAVTRSLPADILTPTAARNLAALQEQRHDLEIQREATLPAYRRALLRTWHVHRTIGDYWAGVAGVRRVRYGPDLHIGFEFAELPRVTDRWQEAQSRQLDVAAGRDSVVEQIMRDEDVTRLEAERRRDERLAGQRAGLPAGAPTPGRAPGGYPRPANVERG